MKKLFIIFAIFFMLMMGCASSTSTNISHAEKRYAVSTLSDEKLKQFYWDCLGALRRAERNATASSGSSSPVTNISSSILVIMDSFSRSKNINNINEIDSVLMIIRSEMSVRGIYP